MNFVNCASEKGFLYTLTKFGTHNEGYINYVIIKVFSLLHCNNNNNNTQMVAVALEPWASH